MKKAIGVDVGGTHIRAGLVVDGKISEEITCVQTPKKYEDFIFVLRNLINGTKEQQDIPVGVTIPGLLDCEQKKIVFTPNLPFLTGKKLSDIYDGAFFANDADMALYGELAQKTFSKSAALFTLGTGVGFAFCLNNVGSWELPNSGEAGHLKVVPGGRLCGCGQRGCLEAYSSGTALLHQAQEKISKKIKSVQELFDLAKNDDEKAFKIINESSYFLGAAIADVVNILGVNEIILGGEIARSYDFFINRVYLSAKENIYAFSKRDFIIKQSKMIDKSAILGVAAFASDQI